MVFLPGRDRAQPREQDARASRGAGSNVAIAVGLTVALLAVAGSLFVRDESWFEEYWPREAVEAVRAELEPEDRVFAPDRFSDWMLFKIPELRGRVAYDVRFEVYDGEFFDRLQDYACETGATGSRSRTATASSSSTRRAARTPRTSSPSPARACLPRRRDHGHRASRARSQPRRGGTRRTPSRSKTFRQAGSRSSRRDERSNDLAGDR